MGYKDEQAVLAAVMEVVFQAASRPTIEGSDSIAIKHPWARELCSPLFAQSIGLHEVAKSSDVVVGIQAPNPEVAIRFPGRLSITVTGGNRVYSFTFKKNEADEYEYNSYGYGTRPATKH